MKKYFFIATFCFAIVFFISSNSAFAAASGSKLFKKYYCIDCHTIGHEGGTVGPDLSNIGKTKSLAWIKAQIFHPGSHFIRGTKAKINGKVYLVRMPGFKAIPDSAVNNWLNILRHFRP